MSWTYIRTKDKFDGSIFVGRGGGLYSGCELGYIFGIGKLLFCVLELENLFNLHGNALKVEKRNANEDQIGYLADSLADKIAPLIGQDFLKTIKAEITDGRIAATEGMWTQGDGMQISCKSELYGYDSHKGIVRNILKK